MLDLGQTPEIGGNESAAETGADSDDPMFAKLHRELQLAKIAKLREYLAKTPTPVVRQTSTTSGLVLLRLAKCWNKPEEHDGGDPCVCVQPDGSHFFRCLHKNCRGLTWKDVEQVYGPLDPRVTIQTLKPRLLTCKQLDSERYNIRYHIENTLVAGQSAVIGGRQKTLKTSIAIDAAISLATGLPFLGRLTVSHPCKVVILSGESGLSVLQETARRIGKAKGVCLGDIDGLLWSEWLPRFDSAKHLEMLEQTIRETCCEVLFIDPVYLAMPGADAGNLFVQGTMLRRVGEMCQEHNVCPILLHHLRKRGKGDHGYDPPELDDLSWAGFSEFARQWWLIGRREPYEPGTGEHKLWLSIGGSAGHSALWAVDIDEGVSGSPRHWKVEVSTSGKARTEKKAQSIRQRLLDAAREFPGGETKTAILETAGLKSDLATRTVFDALVHEQSLIPQVVKKNGATYEGFRLGEVKA